MTREEHAELMRNILAANGDQAKLSTLLTQVSEDYGKILTEDETLKGENETVKKDNENLKNANMQLFLKIPSEPPKKDEPPADEKRTFDELFDEKGGLK